MRPMRGSSRSMFPSLQSAAARLALALVVGSVVFALGRDGLGSTLLLIPAAVLGRLWLWQPLTYAVIETSPMGVLFGALVLWQVGGGLEQRWGSRRVTVFALGTAVVAGLATVLLSFVLPALRLQPFAGGTVMVTALWVAYGLSWGNRPLSFWGIPLTGTWFALIGVLLVFLEGAFSTFYAVVPQAVALLLALVTVRLGGPSSWWLRVSGWRLQRKLRSRSKHLTLLSPERNTSRDSDSWRH